MTRMSGRNARMPTVLGVGNVLLGDEGIGVRAAETLRPRVPAGVRVLDGGPLSPELLPDVEDASHLLVLDCIDAGLPAGKVLRLDGTKLPEESSPHLSPHELGLKDLLALAALHGRAPREVVVMGIQPARIEPGLDLSPEVAASLPRLVDEALAVLARWASGLEGRRERRAGASLPPVG